jgi:hypothetical protein
LRLLNLSKFKAKILSQLARIKKLWLKLLQSPRLKKAKKKARRKARRKAFQLNKKKQLKPTLRKVSMD